MAESASFIASVELRLELGHLLLELLLLLDEHEGEVVLVGRDRGVEVRVDLGQLPVLVGEPLLDLLAAPDDGGGRALQLEYFSTIELMAFS